MTKDALPDMPLDALKDLRRAIAQEIARRIRQANAIKRLSRKR